MTDRPAAPDTSLATSPTEPSPPPSEAVAAPTVCAPQEAGAAAGGGLVLPGAPAAPTLSLDTLPEAEKARLQLLIRGGTTSSQFDKEMQQRVADAEVRRAEADADRKIAQIPIEQGGGLMFESKFTDQSTGPRVLIKYVGKTKEVISEQLCELVEDDTTGDSLFIFVCPECFRRGVPSGFAQCHVRAKHRAWHVDRKTAGQILAARNTEARGGIEYYQNAGEIMDTDVLKCDAANCGCAYKIHRNVMYRVG